MRSIHSILAAMMIAAVCTTAAEAAATKPQKIQGAFCVPLAPNVPSITVQRTNATGQSIHDFTIWIVGNSGAKIGRVEVSSNQTNGADDWDVDDDGDGNTHSDDQERGEKDDVDSSPGTSTRVDCKGDGKDNDGAREPAPQNAAGKPIGKNSAFKIKVTFSPRPSAGASICFAPTDKNAGQIDSGQLSQYCLYDGVNSFEYNSGHPFPSVTSAFVNQTGGIVVGLEITMEDSYSILELEHVDGDGQTLALSSCGGAPTCFLSPAFPIMPGGDVCYSMTLEDAGMDDTYLVNVTPVVDFAVPTGACCLPDGSCMEATFIEECYLRGGVYGGDGAPCDDVYCEPSPTGACVFDETGECYTGYNEWDCTAAGGVFMGADLLCSIDGEDDAAEPIVRFSNLSDLAALLACYGTYEGDESYNPAYDYDGDGYIGLADLAALLSEYGR